MPSPDRLPSESLSIGSVREGKLPADRRTAVTELFDTKYATLVRMARFVVDDTQSAEDIVMEAFTSLYSRWGAMRDRDRAYGYLRSCVLNGARSRLRRRRRHREHETELPPDPEAQALQGDLVAGFADRSAVVEALRHLSARQRQVLVLRYYLELSEAEIAIELKISAGSVKTHASRGLAALAYALEAPR